jgi:8-oxo-dGTP pyrophosphatase MutT (NUDIX family)
MVQQMVVRLAHVDLERRLRRALAGSLPGPSAQAHMAPVPRPGWLRGRAALEARPAAGLILLFPVEGQVHLLLTERASHLPNHAGQVSLPGGAVEPGESVEEAALREAREETGVAGAAVRLLGRLTPLHIPVSGYLLHPVVGVTDCRPAILPARAEVEQVIEPALDDLLDPACVRHVPCLRDTLFDDVPYYAVGTHQVWGATAMILAEFLQVVRQVLTSTSEPPAP